MKFELSEWEDIVEMVAKVLRFTGEEKKNYLSRKLPKLIAAIPIIAGCSQAKRAAFFGVLMYESSCILKRLANATRNDSRHIFKRLELFEKIWMNGDEQLKQRGLSLLAYIMISNYKKDLKDDIKKGKYNPLKEDMDHEEISQRLIEYMDSVPCAEMDNIYDMETAIRGWWNN